MNVQPNQKGFTIIELMIATAVFSTILLLCTFGILQISRMYIKGVTSARAQETARDIIDEIGGAIQFNGADVVNSDATSGLGKFCVGERLYSYFIGKQLTDSATPTGDQIPHVLLVDENACGSRAATPPRDLTDPNLPLASTSRELVSPRMRLARLQIITLTNNLYQITVRVLSGDADLMTDSLAADGSAGTDGVADSCKNERQGPQFCAVSELTTVVQKRIQ